MLGSLFAIRLFVRTKKIKPNQQDFLNLVKAPRGILIPLTPEQKAKINKQIDKKLQELEDTGLSREQILLSKSQKGIPLASDPFFQFMKRNKLARQVYLKKTDRFSVQKIVDIALRQDIGPDKSYSRIQTEVKINSKGRAQLMNNLAQLQRDSFDPKTYYANKQTNVNTLYDQLKPYQPLRHIFTPINRYQRLKTHMRKLKKYDVHWRNVELLRQFLTPFGNIKNRFSNRLSSADQKKISMAIKTARQNCALPHFGKILGPNKKNITSLDDEVKELGLQNVNIETGQIYYTRSRSMDSIEVESEMKRDTDSRYQTLLEQKDKHFQLWIDTPETNENTKELEKAERYARVLKNQQNEEKGRNKKKIDIQKFTLKQLTGVSEEEIVVMPDDSEEARQAFKRRKQDVSRIVQQDTLKLSELILSQKILL